jgi:hypothetical protein
VRVVVISFVSKITVVLLETWNRSAGEYSNAKFVLFCSIVLRCTCTGEVSNFVAVRKVEKLNLG